MRTRCQISSEMKGASGCRARSSVSSVLISVKRVPRLAAAEAESDCSTALDSSRYQSQNSCQVKFVQRVGGDVEAVLRKPRLDALRAVRRAASESSDRPG